MEALVRQTRIMLEMIKFQHTVFALPFAFTGMLMAAGGFPSWYQVTWILLACVFARTAAMSFNRWADREIDKRNPRTETRAIPAGQLRSGTVFAVAIVCAIGFIGCAAMLNPLALALSPMALVVLFGYSYAKRFTSMAHFILGLALALAPVGAWVAVRQEIGLPALWLAAGVMLWTAGFDLIYACQDTEIDRKEGLFSVPARYGPRAALSISKGLHALAVGSFVMAGLSARLGAFYYTGVAIAAVLLLAEHLIVNPHDVRRINLAFFTVNSWVGMAIFAGTAIDILAFS